MRKAEQHSFDIALAVKVGVEKAILLGSIQYWISENEKRKSVTHFQQGEYWTFDTANGLSEKYPYLNAKSIYRWMTELEQDGWIKRDTFKTGNSGKITWYGLGVKMKVWLGFAIPQNEIPISQNEISNSQNEISNSQNEECNSQNEEFSNIYKDTVVNSFQTTVDNTLDADASASPEVFEAVVVDEHLAADLPSTPPVARPPSSPNGAMVRPTLEQVVTHMNLQMAPEWLAENFYDYYESNGWKVGKNPMKKWQAAANKWIRDYKQSPKAHAGNQQTNSNRSRQSREVAGSEIDRLAKEFFGDGY